MEDAIRDLVVHLDGTDQDEPNLAHAEMIATAFGAHVRGIFTRELPGAILAVGPGAEGLSAEFWQDDDAATDRAEIVLRTRMDIIDAETEMMRIDGMRNELNATLCTLAKPVDLVVIGRPYGTHPGSPDFLESVLFNAGAAAFVVPQRHVRPRDPETVMIAWRDSAECSHAIAAALPFLKRARQVHLVSAAESIGEVNASREPASNMARHLARHGVKVEMRVLLERTPASKSLLAEAETIGADLVVLGAYGHSRFRELILGGVTRDLLTFSSVPLLMSH